MSDEGRNVCGPVCSTSFTLGSTSFMLRIGIFQAPAMTNLGAVNRWMKNVKVYSPH